MPGELRWGILACGYISSDFVTALRKCVNPNVVVATAASSLERAQQFCERLVPKAKAYGSYEELLADKDIDVIYIGTINDAHVTWTLKALDAGKHVLCEKPLGVTAKEVKLMTEKAREKKLFLMEAFWSRFFPSWQTLRQVIDSKEFGEVKVAHANFGVVLPPSRMDVSHAETAVADIALYALMFSLWCFKAKPERVTVVGHKDPNDGADRWASIVLQFPGGGHALLYYNGTVNTPNTAFVSFDKGIIQIPEWFWCTTKLVKIIGAPRSGATNAATLDFPLNDDAEYNFNNSSGLRYEADHVYECITNGKTESDIMPLEESLNVAELVEEVRRQLGVVYPQDHH
ncbi:trans-1,2-dihydrobenzene-1,2-diol dehydrogenase-like protein [Aphelenchoides avenae]|nr:trans-1,2-dihydrobenzene-1,2-diol dehydrogenase-like protein [Aphelenchus avenae]